MAERRSLIEGLKPTPPMDPKLEKSFVYGPKSKNEGEEAAPLAPRAERRGDVIGRVPLTTRVRSDFAKALKRASLERQLNGKYPNTLQDILEEALEPWLRSNGYLD